MGNLIEEIAQKYRGGFPTYRCFNEAIIKALEELRETLALEVENRKCNSTGCTALKSAANRIRNL